MLIKKLGIFSICKDGSFYKVYRKRTVVGQFLLLYQAEAYMEGRYYAN